MWHWLTEPPPGEWGSLAVISNFLDQTECDFLKALSGPELRRSRVTNGRVIENRTSYSTFLTGEKVRPASS